MQLPVLTIPDARARLLISPGLGKALTQLIEKVRTWFDPLHYRCSQHFCLLGVPI